MDLIKSAGYSAETHHVTTGDGYILALGLAMGDTVGLATGDTSGLAMGDTAGLASQ